MGVRQERRRTGPVGGQRSIHCGYQIVLGRHAKEHIAAAPQGRLLRPYFSGGLTGLIRSPLRRPAHLPLQPERRTTRTMSGPCARRAEYREGRAVRIEMAARGGNTVSQKSTLCAPPWTTACPSRLPLSLSGNGGFNATHRTNDQSRAGLGAAGILALALVAGTTRSDAQASPTEFSATLRGANEVPPLGTTAQGTFDASIDLATGTVMYTLIAEATGITQAHIHRGAPSENGDVVAFLFGQAPSPVDGLPRAARSRRPTWWALWRATQSALLRRSSTGGPTSTSTRRRTRRARCAGRSCRQASSRRISFPPSRHSPMLSTAAMWTRRWPCSLRMT